ncbi:MAG: peptidoglycan-associated lipoprotein [Glaciecola sp.]|jgi:peptidoglycan-associated lipoprotein
MKSTVNKANANRLNRITLAIAFSSLVSVSALSVAKPPSNDHVTDLTTSTQELKNLDLKHTDFKNKEAQNNAVGLGSGIIVGAVVAGPIGAAIAGLFGLFIADDINDENRLALTKEELNNTNQELIVLQQNYQDSIASANQKIATMDSAMTQVIQGVMPMLEANIQFKTASFLVEDHYKSQLNGLASELRKNPKLTIELSGFADQRGKSTYNQVLSQQRAKSVKDYLVSQFANENQVLTQSFGESELVSESDNFEDNFFDRRVLLKVSNKSADMTAASGSLPYSH